jgi:hypothetical protein
MIVVSCAGFASTWLAHPIITSQTSPHVAEALPEGLRQPWRRLVILVE